MRVIRYLAPACGAILLALSSPTNAQSTPDDLVRGIGNFLSNILQTHGTQLKELAASGKDQEAAQLWARERQFFESRQAEYRPVLTSLAKRLNEKAAGALREPLSRIKNATAPAQWQSYRADRNTVQELIREYDKVELLAREEYSAPAVAEAKTLLTKSESDFVHTATGAFAVFDHVSGASFFREYPANLPPSFLQANFEEIKPTLAKATGPQIEQFTQTYKAQLGDAERDFLAATYVGGPDRPAAEQIMRIVGAAQLGLPLPAAQPLTIVSVLAASGGADETFPVSVASERALEVMKSKPEEIDSTMFSGPGVALLIHIKDTSIERQVVDRSRVPSQYLSGHDTVPNPDYERARLRYLQAQAQSQQTELQNSLNPPASPLVAVLQGVANAIAAAARQKAYEEFSAMSPTLSRPKYAQYQIETAVVKTSRRGTVVLSAIDRRTQAVTQIEYPISEERRFQLAYGVKEEDESRYALSQKYQSEKEVEAYEKSDVSLRLADLVRVFESGGDSATNSSLQGALASVQRSISSKAARAAVRDVSVTEDDPRFASVVIVRSGRSLGAGFFVGENLVVTNDHVVQQGGFAEITLRDGREVYGKVIKRDADADLALIRVAAAVPALQLGDTQLKPGQTVEAIGHPKGLNYSLTRGVVSAVRKNRVPGMRDIVLIQTDAAINPGNSGGPLLDGQTVVGINTLKFRAAEGIGFAVHAQEIRRFIAE
jgi:serine protease Do